MFSGQWIKTPAKFRQGQQFCAWKVFYLDLELETSATWLIQQWCYTLQGAGPGEYRGSFICCKMQQRRQLSMHVTPLLPELHGLSVCFWVQFEVLVLTFIWHGGQVSKELSFSQIYLSHWVWQERHAVGPVCHEFHLTGPRGESLLLWHPPSGTPSLLRWG